MAKIIQDKNGDIILSCECGMIYELHYDEEKDEIITTEKFAKPKEEKKENDKNEKTKKRTGVFRFSTAK